jgi:hypothetical protein
MSTRRWNKYFVNSIRFVRICVIKLLSTLNKLSWSFKRFLKIWDDSATQSLRLFFVWYSLQNRFHLSCNVFLRLLFVIELSSCVVLSFSAQSFANQTRLRSLDVMSTWRRLLSRVWVSLRLILSQCLMIRALCESSCNLILIFVCKYAKCSSMSCICVSTSRISLDVIRNVLLIVRKLCFWRSISLFVKNKVVSENHVTRVTCCCHMWWQIEQRRCIRV